MSAWRKWLLTSHGTCLPVLHERYPPLQIGAAPLNVAHQSHMSPCKLVLAQVQKQAAGALSSARQLRRIPPPALPSSLRWLEVVSLSHLHCNLPQIPPLRSPAREPAKRATRARLWVNRNARIPHLY